MIAFGKEGASPRAKIVTLAPGLGLTNRIIIDQHFRQRDRLGRLLTALAYNPFAIGIGLDENTAAFIGPDETLEVVGGGALTIVDPSELEFSSMARVRKNDPVCLIGLRLHILDHGSTFNLHTRVAAAAPEIAQAGLASPASPFAFPPSPLYNPEPPTEPPACGSSKERSTSGPASTPTFRSSASTWTSGSWSMALGQAGHGVHRPR